MPINVFSSRLFAICAACTGSGFLFFGRGGFLPYFFAIYQDLTPLGYQQIAILLNIFILTQALFAPFSGWFVDRLPVRIQAVMAILLHCLGLSMIIYFPIFLANIFGTMLLSVAFILSKIGFNSIMLEKANPSSVRRVVSFRAVLMNGGSFFGNLLAAHIGTTLGYRTHLLCLAVIMFAAWTFLILYKEPTTNKKEFKVEGRKTLKGVWDEIFQNRPFIADLLRIISITVPYGCWGTIIPKFLMDTYGSVEIIPIVYMTSFLTIILGTHLFNEFIARYFHQRGFNHRLWFPVTLILYLSGLLLFTFSYDRTVLLIGVCVFMIGEISMTPCFDEVVLVHAKKRKGFYIGVIQVTDAGGRVCGSMIAFTIYEYLGQTGSSEGINFFWPVTVLFFAVLSWSLVFGASLISEGSFRYTRT